MSLHRSKGGRAWEPQTAGTWGEGGTVDALSVFSKSTPPLPGCGRQVWVGARTPPLIQEGFSLVETHQVTLHPGLSDWAGARLVPEGDPDTVKLKLCL